MRILFCEDHALLRKLIALSMRGTPHEFWIAGSGAQAIEIARQVRPEALVTDVVMPGMDGFELVTRLRAEPRLRDMRVIFMTASADVNDVSAGMKPYRYLPKPFGPAELRAALVALEHDSASAAGRGGGADGRGR
jgi:CheY-like chemotaxis protein